MTLNFLNTEKVESLEQYATALVLSMRSLVTLQKWQLSAIKSGVLDDGEEQRLSLIAHDIVRVVRLCEEQLTDVLERTNIKKTDLINQINKLKP